MFHSRGHKPQTFTNVVWYMFKAKVNSGELFKNNIKVLLRRTLKIQHCGPGLHKRGKISVEEVVQTIVKHTKDNRDH